MPSANEASVVDLVVQGPDIETPALKALARLYEKRHAYGRAVKLWEAVRKADPSDTEAPGKINDLAASETIARGGYKG